MATLLSEHLRWTYGDVHFECIWKPRRQLSDVAAVDFLNTIDAINNKSRQPLRSGFFLPTRSLAWRMEFLERSIWCVIHAVDGPVGYAYQVDLGTVAGQRFLHAGLVQFSRRLGGEMIAAATLPLVLGNLERYGSYVCSNITHVPLIASVFWSGVEDVFPHPVRQSAEEGGPYRAHLRHLGESYISPVLGHPADSICTETFRIRDSLLRGEKAYKTRWDELPRALDSRHTDFLDSWLRFRIDEAGVRHVCDDLIQIGRVTDSILGRMPFAECYANLKLA